MLVLDYIKIKHIKINTFLLKKHEASDITIDQYESAKIFSYPCQKIISKLIYLKSI